MAGERKSNVIQHVRDYYSVTERVWHLALLSIHSGAFLTDKDRPLSVKDKKRNREIMREQTAREGVRELTLNEDDNLNIVS